MFIKFNNVIINSMKEAHDETCRVDMHGNIKSATEVEEGQNNDNDNTDSAPMLSAADLAALGLSIDD